MVRGLLVIGVFFIALQFSVLNGEAAEKAKRKAQGEALKPDKKEPIIITSDRMEVNRKKNLITYKGNVIAVWGEATMKSEVLRAVYGPGMGRLQRVVAEGKVRVNQGGRVGTGAKAVFNSRGNTITLSGNAVVRQGRNRVSGSRIILFLDEDRGVVEGGSQRVKAIIFPEGLEK